ncbi:MAG: FapA family protein [Candidatus Cloacimonetes bacterium]|nr:FapA family protein [Candidatus Cloacimonadota bacterium]
MNKTITNAAGNLILELRQDSMSAWLTIKETGKLIDERDIVSLIEEAGIKTGFDEALRFIRENDLEKEYNVPFPIAVCNVSEGSSTLRYHFNPDLKPDFSHGLILSELERLHFVSLNGIVADYSHNLFEQEGSIYDIFGELIQPDSIDTDQAKKLEGNNVRYDAATREFIACKPGYPYLDEQGKICVSDLLLINGEDFPSDASISVPVDLVIQGNLACAEIECLGSLSIRGDLHSSSLICHSDLLVNGDIVSCNKQGVLVWGETTCSGIRESRLFCKKQIRFSETIENCVIATDSEIIGIGNNSEIKGGSTQAGGSISIAKAGMGNNNVTEIEIAISPFYRAILMQMTRELIKLKDDTEGNSVAINELQSKIKVTERELDDQLNAFLHRPAEDRKSVIVSSEIKPLTSIRVLKHTYEISSHQFDGEFIEKD